MKISLLAKLFLNLSVWITATASGSLSGCILIRFTSAAGISKDDRTSYLASHIFVYHLSPINHKWGIRLNNISPFVESRKKSLYWLEAYTEKPYVIFGRTKVLKRQSISSWEQPSLRRRPLITNRDLLSSFSFSDK